MTFVFLLGPLVDLAVFLNTLITFVWLGGVVFRALDLRREIAGLIPAAALSSETLEKLFTHIVQRL